LPFVSPEMRAPIPRKHISPHHSKAYALQRRRHHLRRPACLFDSRGGTPAERPSDPPGIVSRPVPTVCSTLARAASLVSQLVPERRSERFSTSLVSTRGPSVLRVGARNHSSANGDPTCPETCLTPRLREASLRRANANVHRLASHHSGDECIEDSSRLTSGAASGHSDPAPYPTRAGWAPGCFHSPRTRPPDRSFAVGRHGVERHPLAPSSKHAGPC
jgi:hypothetical protein